MSMVEYMQLYVDINGESHFQSRQVELTATNYAPPAPALDVSPIAPATGCGFARLAPGWVGDWHPSLTPQMKYIHIYTDANGETDRKDLEVGYHEVNRQHIGSVNRKNRQFLV